MSSSAIYLGNRRYSSWSLRGWLCVKLAGLAVEEIVIPMTEGGTPAIQQTSPSGLVPYLVHAGAEVWDSLAIAEYCAEHNPALWPSEPAVRAWARAMAAEMHAGFRELRIAMPMNLGRDFAGRGRTAGALKDIARIEALWAQTRARYGAGGPYLFGADFNAVDAFFAPVAARFITYQPELKPETLDYAAAVRTHGLVAAWYDAAAAEPAAWLVPKYEELP